MLSSATQHHAFAGKLLSERDRAYSDRDSSRKRYFDACETLESARQKKAQAKDDRQSELHDTYSLTLCSALQRRDPTTDTASAIAAEKATKSYHLAEEDMNIAKNQFLIDTDTANVHKQRLYSSDLPSLHDDFQLLSASTVNQLVHLLRTLCGVQRDSLTRLQGSVDLSEQAVNSIDVYRDQEMFVTMHSASKLGGWEIPPDLGFEECPVWHDTAGLPLFGPLLTLADTFLGDRMRCRSPLHRSSTSRTSRSSRRLASTRSYPLSTASGERSRDCGISATRTSGTEPSAMLAPFSR